MPDVSALWYLGGGRAELRPEPRPTPGLDQILVRAHYSAVSRGTERLVFHGRVPVSEHERMRCPYQAGAFPFPVKYGYAVAGETADGRRVFVLHPHQDLFVVPAAAAHPIPDGVPMRRAPLAANMETALNVVWDGRVAPGDSVLIVGGGVLGLLIARLAARIPGTAVTVCDVDASREPVVRGLGASFARPDAAPHDQDVVIHTSATAAGLAMALNAAGFEARVVEASWHGDGAVATPLGGAFHSRRLQLISSQVGHVPADHRARWSHARRLALALDLLRDESLDVLITGEIAFADAPEMLPAVFASGAPGLASVLRY